MHCLAYRLDGRVLIAGDAEGAIRIYDAASMGKSVLATIPNAHEQSVLRFTVVIFANFRPIRTCAFPPLSTSTRMLTGGDDGIVKCWSTAGGKQAVWSSDEGGHTDFVRCVRSSTMHEAIIFSGSYDHTVACWDTRLPGTGAVFQLEHKHQVEDVLPMTNDTTLAVASELID